MLTKNKPVKYMCPACECYTDYLVYKNGLSVCPDCARNWERSERLVNRLVKFEEFKSGVDPTY